MKKIFFAILSLAFVSAGAQTVEEVIQKYSDNLGGLDAFNKIKTVKMTGTFSTQGNDLPLTVHLVNGKASRTELDFNGNKLIRVYNNGKGWTQNPFAGAPVPKEATPEELIELKPQSMMANALMDYKARGHKVELAGQQDVEGIKAFKVKLTNKDDNKATYYYISTADYSLFKSESEREMQGQMVTIETYYSDVKVFNGLKFSMTRTQKLDGQEFQTTKFESVELDVTIDEKIFDMQ